MREGRWGVGTQKANILICDLSMLIIFTSIKCFCSLKYEICIMFKYAYLLLRGGGQGGAGRRVCDIWTANGLLQ